MFLCKLLYLSALLLILVPLIISLPHPHHDVHKRSSFFDIDCKGEIFIVKLDSAVFLTDISNFCILGVFNKSIFFRLDRICEDCYSLFREVELHSLCKWVLGSNLFRQLFIRFLPRFFSVLSSSLTSFLPPITSELSRFNMFCITQRISDYLDTFCDVGHRFNLHFFRGKLGFPFSEHLFPPSWAYRVNYFNFLSNSILKISQLFIFLASFFLDSVSLCVLFLGRLWERSISRAIDPWNLLFLYSL